MKKNKPEIGTCSIELVNEKNVNLAQKKLPDENAINNLSAALKVLSNPARLKLFLALKYAELCVCDCSKILGQSLPATSQHLKELRNIGVVTFRQDGKLAFYQLTPNKYINPILEMILDKSKKK